MNLYRVVTKRGKKILDEQSISADSAYEADARATARAELQPGDTIVVYNEVGRQCFRHSVKKRKAHATL